LQTTWSSGQREKRGFPIRQESLDFHATRAEQSNDFRRGAISESDPNHLWRRPVEDAKPMKVFILGYDCEAAILRILPNLAIGRACQPEVNDVGAIGICVCKLTEKASRKVLVKKNSVRLISQRGHS
jgi:hypothetical protein